MGQAKHVQATLHDRRHDRNQYLSFLVGGEVFALGILAIKEIIEYGQLTTVPMMPAFVRGVINLRGAVVPVIDLAARFGRLASPNTKRTCVVITEVDGEGGKEQVGMVVEAVNEVLEITADEIEPAPAFGSSVRTDFIAGLGKVNGKFVVILNVDRVLSMDEMVAINRIAAAVTGEPA
jgi:purine-binding chemotaxis protein CheW